MNRSGVAAKKVDKNKKSVANKLFTTDSFH
jgi:hypothetical protein